MLRGGVGVLILGVLILRGWWCSIIGGGKKGPLGIAF